MSKLIVNKMLHNPMVQLRKASEDNMTREMTNHTAKYLFNLNDEMEEEKENI